jgi:hypothetical protein
VSELVSSGRKRRLVRNVLFAIVPFIVVAIVTLIAYPGLRPTQQGLTLIACAGGAIAAFEVRRRMDAMLRALAREHDATLPANNVTGTPVS